MVDFGAVFRNESGIVQIDSDYDNYEAVASGSAADGAATYYPAGLGSDALFFLRNTTPGDIVTRGLPTPGVYHPAPGPDHIAKLMPGVGHYFVAMNTSSNRPMEYVVMSRRSLREPPRSGYGMVVLDANGRCCFSSLDRYLNIVATIRAPFSKSVQRFTLPAPKAGKNYYALINSMYGSAFRRSGGQLRAYCPAISFVAPNVVDFHSYVEAEVWGPGTVINGLEEKPSGAVFGLIIAEM